MQLCVRCDLQLPFVAFKPNARGKSGHWCRDCHADYQAERRAASPEEYRIKHAIEERDRRKRDGEKIRTDDRARYKANERRQRSWRRRKWGHLVPHILEAQNHCCAGCGRHIDKTACLDHCHATGRLRGMLCDCCNFAIGQAQDSPATLRRLAAYLEKQPT